MILKHHEDIKEPKKYPVARKSNLTGEVIIFVSKNSGLVLPFEPTDIRTPWGDFLSHGIYTFREDLADCTDSTKYTPINIIIKD